MRGSTTRTLCTGLTLALLVSSAGCKRSDDDPATGQTPPAARDGGAKTAPPPNNGTDVTGTNIDTYVTANGDVEVPEGPDEYKVSALVPQSDGTFVTIGATTSADGTFRIQKVPQGIYYLRYDFPNDPSPWFTVTDKRTHELGAIFSGRPKPARATQPTPLTIDLKGLSPWTEADSLGLHSVNSGFDQYVSTHEPTPVALGATEVTRMMDLGDASDYLVDSGQGDTMLVYQKTDASAGDLAYQAVIRAAEVTNFSQADGESKTLPTSLHDVEMRSLSFTWNQTDFAKIAADVSPLGKVMDHDFTVIPEPAGPGRFSIGFVPDIFYMRVDAELEGTRDRSVQNARFGNPYPSAWPLWAIASTDVYVDQGQGLGTWVSVDVFGSLEALTGRPIIPIVGPPRELQVNGVSATRTVGGAGTTPTISWKAPALGTPDGYGVGISQEGADPLGQVGQTRLTEVASFSLTGTSLRVPPGVLQDGSRYVIQVRAHGPGPDGLRGGANVVSGLITP